MIRRAVKNMDYYLKNISSLDNKSYVYIRYEDLCEKPREEILKVMNFLDLESKVKINYNKKINPRKNSLIKELQILQPYTLKKMKNYLSYIKDNNIFK